MTDDGAQTGRFGSLGARIAMIAADHRARFLVVGGVNTVVGYALFLLFDLFVFHGLEYGYLLSLFVSYAISIGLAFVLYRRFVFNVSGRVIRDLVAFIGVNLSTVAINAVLLWALVSLAGIPGVIAQAIALVVTVLLSYFGHRGVSFRRDEQA